MTADEFRQEMDRYWEEVNRDALDARDSYRALDRLHSLYRNLDREERALADDVLSQWALSDDETKRFDAMALISEFRVTGAVPALQKLTQRLHDSREPGAPFEIAKAERIMSDLSADAANSGSTGS